MEEIIKLIINGGPFALSIALMIGIVVLWKHHTFLQKASVERHKERDDQFSKLQAESIETLTKVNTFLEIIVNRGQD